MYILESLSTGWTITEQESISFTSSRNIKFISESVDSIAKYAIDNNIFDFNLILCTSQIQLTESQQLNTILPLIKPPEIEKQQLLSTLEQPSKDRLNPIEIEKQHTTQQQLQPLQNPITNQTTFKPIIFENTPPEQIITHYTNLLGQFSTADFHDVKIINYTDFSQITTRKFYTDGGLAQKQLGFGMGGYATIEVVNNNIVNEFLDGFTNTTNRRIEMVAILQVLESCNQKDIAYIGTESQKTFDIFTKKLSQYISSGRIRDDIGIKNLDLFCRILCSLKGRRVEFCFVQGQSDDKFKKYVDGLKSRKVGGNDDFYYLQSLKTDKCFQFMEIDAKTIFMKNSVFSRDYFIQTQFWIEKLNNVQQNCNSHQVFNIDKEQFRKLQIPKYYYHASGGDNKGGKGGFCIVQYDKLLYLPVQFHLISSIRAQLYGILFILILTQPAKAICIMADNLLSEDILITRRTSWVNSYKNNSPDADLVAQIYFYSLGRQIYIIERTLEDHRLILDSQSILSTDKQLNHDISFETLKISQQSNPTNKQHTKILEQSITKQIKK